jgi:hypothetical protein
MFMPMLHSWLLNLQHFIRGYKRNPQLSCCLSASQDHGGNGQPPGRLQRKPIGIPMAKKCHGGGWWQIYFNRTISHPPVNSACKCGINTLKIDCFGAFLLKKMSMGSVYCLHPIYVTKCILVKVVSCSHAYCTGEIPDVYYRTEIIVDPISYVINSAGSLLHCNDVPPSIQTDGKIGTAATQSCESVITQLCCLLMRFRLNQSG